MKRKWLSIRSAPVVDVRASVDAVAVEVSNTDNGVRITVETIGQLGRAQIGSGASKRVATVELVVTRWHAPWAGWSGRPAPLPGLIEYAVRYPDAGVGPATVRMALIEPLQLDQVVTAAMTALRPLRNSLAAGHVHIRVVGERPAWLARELGIEAPSGRTASKDLRQHDILLVDQATGSSNDVESIPVLVTNRFGAALAGEDLTILVDAVPATSRNHLGPLADRPAATLTVTGGGVDRWQVAGTRGAAPTLAAGRIAEPLDEYQAAALARLRAVRCPPQDEDVPPAMYATVLAQLAMTGVVLDAGDLAKGVERLLVPDLADLLAQPLPIEADPIAWEARAVAQRRAALRGHAAGLALARLLAPAYPSLPAAPPVSALLVTRRPASVARVINQLVDQSYPQVELVLGLHGCALPDAVRDRLAHCRIPVTVLSLSAELSLGEALAGVTRAASGTLVTKIDDDDRYGPQHIWDLVLAWHCSGATVAGKAAEYVYLERYDSTIRRRMGSEMYTDVVAGGAMLLSRGDLERVGGWRPVHRSVDRALLDDVLAAGGLIYRTHGFGFIYCRHDMGHTWDPGMEYFLRDPVQQWSGIPPFEEFA